MNSLSRGNVTKNDLLSKVYKQKTRLYDGDHGNKNGDWHDGAHYAFNKILDILNEYAN